MIRKITTAPHMLLLLLAILLSCGRPAAHRAGGNDRNTIATVRTTPVKQQGDGTLCWLYAMTATLESEHLGEGDSVNLSAAFVARMMLHDEAVRCFRGMGRTDIALRGMMPTALHYINMYGIVPYDSYVDAEDADWTVLLRKITAMARAAAARHEEQRDFESAVNSLLDDELGPLPAPHVYMFGAEYTRQEFAHSVCAPDEYVFLCSTTGERMNTPVMLNEPDNVFRDTFRNVPLDTLMLHIRRAVSTGHPVCWEGHVLRNSILNENSHGSSYIDEPATATAAERERRYQRLETTDDHALCITGLVRHGGKLYYKCKNSWGEKWGDKGYCYLSENYIAMNTIAVAMSRKAYAARHAQP